MRVIARSGGYISRKFTPCRSGRRIRSFSRVIAPFPVERPDVAVSVSGADSARWRLPRMAPKYPALNSGFLKTSAYLPEKDIE